MLISGCFRSLAEQGQSCLNYTYQSMLDDLLQTEWDKAIQVGGRQWTYQTCSEFGWYQSSDQPNHPYGSRFPVKDSIKVKSSYFVLNISYCPDKKKFLSHFFL